jgi:hypothetical protein
MKNAFGVTMPAGNARGLRVATAWPAHAAHAAAGPATAGIAMPRKRRTAAATDASVGRGIV